MKSITLNFSDANFTVILDGNSEAMGYEEMVPNPTHVKADPETTANPKYIPNPESTEQFVTRKLMEMLVENVVSVEGAKESERALKERQQEITDLLGA